jgi:peptidoglycan/xylan/chitin deacetylase (PgdA/CDA1 family)
VCSLILTIVFGFVVLNPFSNSPESPPITEATVDVPFGLRYPFPLQVLHPPSEQDRPPSPQSNILEEARVREIKERIRISLIKEYPSGSQRTVGISGQAPEGSICALYLNDALYEATTCANGTFFFPRVALMSGKNFIEVLAHDPEGYVIPSNRVALFVGRNRHITERGRNITRGGVERPLVCLTFDGGASASCATEILDTLRAYGVQCTFFLTGDFIRNHPGIVTRMVEEGHEIGNHTDTHPHFARITAQMRFETLPWVTRAFVQSQIKLAEKAFFEITGQRMSPFWRAPYGEHNLEILEWAEEIGYMHVSWTCGRVYEESLDTLDWVYNRESPIYYSAQEIRDKIIHFGEGTPEEAHGGIVLMHLATSRPLEDRIHRQIPGIIEGLRKRGYTLSTIGDLLELPGGSVTAGADKDAGSFNNPWISKKKEKMTTRTLRRRVRTPSSDGGS